MDQLGHSQGVYQHNFVQVLSPFQLVSFPISTSPLLLLCGLFLCFKKNIIKLLLYVVLILAVKQHCVVFKTTILEYVGFVL